MGLIAGPLVRAQEKRATLADPPGWMLSAFGATSTAAGKTVSDQTAITFSAVYAAVKVLSESVAMLPCLYYRRLQRGKERAHDRPLYELLRYQPNPEQTASAFWGYLMANVAMRGNAYAIKEVDGRGRVREIWPLRSDQCTLTRKDGRLVLIWRPTSMAEQTFDASAVFRFHGLSYDGITGLSPIAVARQGIGLALAAEEYGGTLFKNDARPGGVLEHPGKLDDVAHTRLRTSWNELHQSASNAHKLAILEEGMKWTQVGISPEDSQFLQTRKFQITDIARIYRLPPHKIGDLERSTFSNIEHQGLEFVTDSLSPWLRQIEDAIRRDLILPADRSSYFAEFLLAALLRGDSASRAAYYRERWGLGSLSPNDIRELENENPIEGGDEYFVPLNYSPLSQSGAIDAMRDDPGEPESRDRASPPARETRAAQVRRRIGRSFSPVFMEAAERLRKLEDVELRKLAKKHLSTRDISTFDVALDELYAEDGEMREKIGRIMGPTFLAYGREIWAEARGEVGADPDAGGLDDFVALLVAGFVSRHAVSSAGQMKTVSRETDALAAVDGRLENWRDTRPGKIATREIGQSNGAVALHAFRTGGVTKKQWVAFGDTCPYCTGLDGRIVGIEHNFVGKGDSIGPTGDLGLGKGPLRVSNSIGHPPIHPGCDCAIVAV